MDKNRKTEKRRTPLQVLLDGLYPPKCAICQDIVSWRSGHLCPGCRELLAQSQLRFPFELPEGMVCASAFYYEEPLRSAFLRYKFQGMEAYGPMLGDYVAGAVKLQLVGGFDLVTWAPLSKKRLRKREYDQAGIFAKQVSLGCEIPLVSTLVKIKNTRAQSGMNARQRQENTRDVYALKPGAEVKGKRILLVDDVVTTGNTLQACAGVLLENGATQVVCATLARHRE